MAIAACDTFDYVFTVPDGESSFSRTVPGTMRDAGAVGTEDRCWDIHRSSQPSPIRGSRGSYTAARRSRPPADGTRQLGRFFSVERALITALRPGDSIHLSLSWPTFGPFDVHGARVIVGMPSAHERVSIERRRVCPDTAAHTTAQLFETEPLEIGDWDG